MNEILSNNAKTMIHHISENEARRKEINSNVFKCFRLEARSKKLLLINLWKILAQIKNSFLLSTN
jgi:hypothetical protein